MFLSQIFQIFLHQEVKRNQKITKGPLFVASWRNPWPSKDGYTRLSRLFQFQAFFGVFLLFLDIKIKFTEFTSSRPFHWLYHCCHSLSLIAICCHSLSYSQSLFVTYCTTRCHSLYHSLSLVVLLVVPLVVTRCHSLSFVVTRCHSMYHSSFFL